jgi:transcriptional regulator with XRE-family HTH domain
MVQTSLGMRLRVLRAERGLSLRQVEAGTGVAKETLSEIERGVRHPYDTTLGKLAKFYDVPVEGLLEEPALSGKA